MSGDEHANHEYSAGALGEEAGLRESWAGFTNGAHYPSEVDDAVVEALCAAHVKAVNAALPDGWTWYPAMATLVGPYHGAVEDLGDLQELFDRTSDEVAEQLEEIERDVMGRVGDER